MPNDDRYDAEVGGLLERFMGSESLRNVARAWVCAKCHKMTEDEAADAEIIRLFKGVKS